jgi:type I restriction enzyme R subunit
MPVGLTESEVEQPALVWLEALGHRVLLGPDIARGEMAAERTDYSQVVLTCRLRDALGQLNPNLPAEALEQAARKVTRPQPPSSDAPLALLSNGRTRTRGVVLREV